MLHLVWRCEAEHPGNPLVRTCPGCQACADYGETVGDAEYGVRGGGASAVAAHRLGPSFLKAWADAAHRDPLFRKAQRDLRDAMCGRGPSSLRSCGTPRPRGPTPARSTRGRAAP
jgi:hypothetical protein